MTPILIAWIGWTTSISILSASEKVKSLICSPLVDTKDVIAWLCASQHVTNNTSNSLGDIIPISPVTCCIVYIHSVEIKDGMRTVFFSGLGSQTKKLAQSLAIQLFLISQPWNTSKSISSWPPSMFHQDGALNGHTAFLQLGEIQRQIGGFETRLPRYSRSLLSAYWVLSTCWP